MQRSRHISPMYTQLTLFCFFISLIEIIKEKQKSVNFNDNYDISSKFRNQITGNFKLYYASDTEIGEYVCFR